MNTNTVPPRRSSRDISSAPGTAEAVAPDDLRRLRDEAGLTQRQLSALADCSLSWIANAEGGYVPRSGDVLDRVLGVLNDERQPAEVATVKEPRMESEWEALLSRYQHFPGFRQMVRDDLDRLDSADPIG